MRLGPLAQQDAEFPSAGKPSCELSQDAKVAFRNAAGAACGFTPSPVSLLPAGTCGERRLRPGQSSPRGLRLDDRGLCRRHARATPTSRSQRGRCPGRLGGTPRRHSPRAYDESGVCFRSRTCTSVAATSFIYEAIPRCGLIVFGTTGWTYLEQAEQLVLATGDLLYAPGAPRSPPPMSHDVDRESGQGKDAGQSPSADDAVLRRLRKRPLAADDAENPRCRLEARNGFNAISDNPNHGHRS
ncbi:hypothetical protein PG988_016255 [Apiospora saccharicola]